MPQEDDKKLATTFQERFAELQSEKGDNLTLTDIRMVVKDLTQKNDNSLYEKILAIAVKIHKLKDEFSDMDGSRIEENIPGAHSRLEAVVEATEKATNEILDAASAMQEEIGDKASEEFSNNVTRIFEACNFQDITGQHINNVVKTLMDVDSLVKAIIKILPEDFKNSVKEESKNPDDDLMSGPQLSSDAPTQEDIDKLFAEL